MSENTIHTYEGLFLFPQSAGANLGEAAEHVIGGGLLFAPLGLCLIHFAVHGFELALLGGGFHRACGALGVEVGAQREVAQHEVHPVAVLGAQLLDRGGLGSNVHFVAGREVGRGVTPHARLRALEGHLETDVAVDDLDLDVRPAARLPVEEYARVPNVQQLRRHLTALLDTARDREGVQQLAVDPLGSAQAKRAVADAQRRETYQKQLVEQWEAEGKL